MVKQTKYIVSANFENFITVGIVLSDCWQYRENWLQQKKSLKNVIYHLNVVTQYLRAFLSNPHGARDFDEAR